MKQRKFLKSLSLFLMVVLLSSVLLPFSASAAEEPASEQDAIPEPTVVPKDAETLQREIEDMAYEIISLREENVKHFRLGDGTYQAVVYGEAVHRKNEKGEWVEIDNSLSELNGAIATNDARIKFSKKITGNESLFTLHEGSYKMTVGLEGAEKKTEATVRDLSEEADSNSTTLEKLKHLSNISAGVLYENILPGTDLEYILRSNYLKENLIVKEPQESYCYTFTLDLSGLTAEMQDGDIVMNDRETGETVYRIPAPYLYDAAGVYSYDASYTLTETGNGKYTYTLTANAEWINSEERVFPVVIDPMLVDIGQIEDTYVWSNYPSTNFGHSQTMRLNSSSKAYYKFATPHLPDGVTITTATLKIPYYFSSNSGASMKTTLHPVTASWSESTVTWNTAPSYSSTTLGTATMYTSASVNSPLNASFSVTNYVASWYNGSQNYGFVLLRSGGTESEALLPAKEKVQVFAQLSISYSGTQAPEGVFYIKRASGTVFMQANRSQPSVTQHVGAFSTSSSPIFDNNPECFFKIAYRPDHNDYVIRSMTDSSLVLYPDITNGRVALGHLSTNDNSLGTAYTWNITITSSYHYITHTRNGITYYISSLTNEADAELALATSTTQSYERWSLTRYNGAVYEDLVLTSFKHSVTVGERFQFHANVVSTRIGQNGPVTYQISYLGSSDVADFYPAIGILKGNEVCTVSIGMTYNGAPSVWWWVIQIRTAGCRPYVDIPNSHPNSNYINCEGFAFGSFDEPNWRGTDNLYVPSLNVDPNDILKPYEDTGLRYEFETEQLDKDYSGRWMRVTSENGGWDLQSYETGQTVHLADNQWLVAMRVGATVDINKDSTSPEYWYYIDVHFWYRTNTGEWAHKPGTEATALLGDDLPTDDDSIGWNPDEVTHYNSDIIYYIITEAN